MPCTDDLAPQSPFPPLGDCPVCTLSAASHCAVGHAAQFRPRYGLQMNRWLDPRGHNWGRPYYDAWQQERHRRTCPWAAGGGQKWDYFAEPNWPLPDDYARRVLAPEPELEAFLFPVCSKKVVRDALDAAEAGCVVIAVADHNWVASLFAGRWAYDVRLETRADGRIGSSSCNCTRPESPCVHVIATWIVWASGAVSQRPVGAGTQS